MSFINSYQHTVISSARRLKTESEIQTIGGTSKNFDSRFSDQSFFSQANEENLYPDHKLNIKARKLGLLKKNQNIKEGIGKIILYYQLVLKDAVKKLKCLSNDPTSCYLLSGKKVERNIGQSIVWKSKITLETSLIRSIMQLQSTKNISELTIGQKPAFSICSSKNVTIYPDQVKILRLKQKSAIINLILFQQHLIKKCISQFQQNACVETLKKKYCQKLCRLKSQNLKFFFKQLQFISQQTSQKVSQKKNVLSSLLKDCFNRRDKVFVQNLRDFEIISSRSRRQALSKLLHSSRFVTLQALLLWHRKVRSGREKKRSQSLVLEEQLVVSVDVNTKVHKKQTTDIDEAKNERPETDKVRGIKKWMMKRYLRQWQQHARFRKNLQRCAIKLACAPKISVERSLLRLSINANRVDGRHSP